MTGSSAYWRTASDDEAMQHAHGFIWKAMLDTVDVDLAGTRVLDAGCNQGGFLRLMTDACAIAEGRGYDPAAGAISDARRLAGDRPLHFEVADTVPPEWRNFDHAFSHEVLYLIHDLAAHAEAIFAALAPGGSYFAVIGVHADSPLMIDWHRDHVDDLQLPKLYSIDEVAGVFAAAGFEVAGARLKFGFVPASGHDHGGDSHDSSELLRWIDYFNDHKVIVRGTRPSRHR